MAQTQDTFMAHTLGTESFDWLFDWLECIAPVGLQCAFAESLALFIPDFITDLDQCHLVSRTMAFAFSEVVLVSIQLLTLINQVSPSMLKWISQKISRREKLQTYHTIWPLIDWLPKRLIQINRFLITGKSSIDTETAQRTKKTIFEWYFCSTKSDWSKSVMKWPWGWNVQVNELAGAFQSSQSNNQSRDWVIGVRAINLSRVCAKTLSRIVKRVHFEFHIFPLDSNWKVESKFRKYQEVLWRADWTSDSNT